MKTTKAGPFGVPMTDAQAFALEARLKQLPGETGLVRHAVAQPALPVTGEGRAEVSWITVEGVDRTGDVVLAAGMDDSHFRLNPIVTLNHAYDRPPVGRSLWRKVMRQGGRVGVQAKTYYPPRPESWTGGPWPADLAHDLVRTGLLNGKSIGFLPLKVRPPRGAEQGMGKVRCIIEEWLLVEYACCFLPMQPQAVVLPGEGGERSDLARCLEPAAFGKLLEKSLQRVLASAEKSVNIH